MWLSRLSCRGWLIWLRCALGQADMIFLSQNGTYSIASRLCSSRLCWAANSILETMRSWAKWATTCMASRCPATFGAASTDSSTRRQRARTGTARGTLQGKPQAIHHCLTREDGCLFEVGGIAAFALSVEELHRVIGEIRDRQTVNTATAAPSGNNHRACVSRPEAVTSEAQRFSVHRHTVARRSLSRCAVSVFQLLHFLSSDVTEDSEDFWSCGFWSWCDFNLQAYCPKQNRSSEPLAMGTCGRFFRLSS